MGESDIFIITSVIHTGNIGWSYFPTRSLFSSEQRFEQTLETIKSIRQYTHNSKIILVEASKLSTEHFNIFKEKCDYIQDLSDDLETHKNCILSNCKGLGDSWLLFKGLEYIKNNSLSGRNIYKISGRYKINNNYNSNNISNVIPTFSIGFTTFFFSVPYKMINIFESVVLKVVEAMKKNNTICIEYLLPPLFAEKHIVNIIGCEGIIAVDKSYKSYSV